MQKSFMIALASFVALPALACDFGYEDLTQNTVFDVTLVDPTNHFVTGGLQSQVKRFKHPGLSYLYGNVTVVNAGSCGTGKKLYAVDATIFHDFTAMNGVGAMRDLTMTIREQGDYFRFGINGKEKLANDIIDLDGQYVGGVQINVLSGGSNDACSSVVLTGVVHTFSVGGRKVLLDCVSGLPAPPEECSWDFDFLQLEAWQSPTVVDVGTPDRPLLANIMSYGFPCPDIYARVEELGEPCLSGKALAATCARYHFTLNEAVAKVAFTSTDAGGEVLVGANGFSTIAGDFHLMHGAVLGGATVNVIYGSSDSCARIEIVGNITNFDIGGTELWFDCIRVEGHDGVSADMNNDGSVNGADLAELLGRWGTSYGDLTGDDQTNGGDLAVLLGAWSP